VKPIIKKLNKERAFTIVELLTVMSIIVILISLLVPALNMVKRYARDVRQRAQFHSIGVALDLFHGEFDDYPPSGAKDTANVDYCGAMKLAEAMVGQDLLGFHTNSVFKSNGMDSSDTIDLYPVFTVPPTPAEREGLRARRGPYLQVENANAYLLVNLYEDTPPFDPCDLVLCDVYTRVRHRETGKKVGMPVLYYKADTSKTGHEYQLDNSQNIYNCDDNIALIDLGLPWDTAHQHPMASLGGTTPDGVASNPAIFYDKTKNEKVASIERPYRPDSYILISAGFDGLYGTDDDIFNFER
jgi:type II secretory pathway pseudopilin PulG